MQSSLSLAYGAMCTDAMQMSDVLDETMACVIQYSLGLALFYVHRCQASDVLVRRWHIMNDTDWM